MPTLVRLFALMLCILIPTISHGDELLSDLEELYTLTENCSEQTEIALRWGMVLRQSPMRSPKRKELLESVYQKALVSCAQPSIRAQAIFELGIVAFGDGDFLRAKELFTRLLNRYRDDLLVIDGLYWLGETLSELGDLKRAGRALIAVKASRRRPAPARGRAGFGAIGPGVGAAAATTRSTSTMRFLRNFSNPRPPAADKARPLKAARASPMTCPTS